MIHSSDLTSEILQHRMTKIKEINAHSKGQFTLCVATIRLFGIWEMPSATMFLKSNRTNACWIFCAYLRENDSTAHNKESKTVKNCPFICGCLPVLPWCRDQTSKSLLSNQNIVSNCATEG